LVARSSSQSSSHSFFDSFMVGCQFRVVGVFVMVLLRRYMCVIMRTC
jgi:hypothetical protein